MNSACSVDINECEGNPCDANATCRDTIGSFICTCDNGFTGDGFNCSSESHFLGAIQLVKNSACPVDINECDENPCDANATCRDTIGSFICTCDDGFTGDGFNCSSESHFLAAYEHTCPAIKYSTCSVDFNECDGNPCDANATCFDSIGSFICTCDNGFTGNGVNCSSEISSCIRSHTTSNEFCMFCRYQ